MLEFYKRKYANSLKITVLQKELLTKKLIESSEC